MPDQVMTNDKVASIEKASDKTQNQSATDEVTAILASSSKEDRDAIYSRMQGHQNADVSQLLGLTNDIDVFLTDSSRDSGVHAAPGQIERLGPNQDVLKINGEKTTTYLGRNGDSQSFEQLADGKISITNSDGRGGHHNQVIDNVQKYEIKDNVPVITLKNGEEVRVNADGSQQHKSQDGKTNFTLDRDQQLTRYEGPGIKMEKGPDGKWSNGATEVTRSATDGTLSYKSADGWTTKVSPDGKEYRTRGTGENLVEEWRDKPGDTQLRESKGPGLAHSKRFDDGTTVVQDADGNITWRKGETGDTYRFKQQPGEDELYYLQRDGGDKVELNNDMKPQINWANGNIAYVERGLIMNDSKRLDHETGRIENN